MTDLVPRPDAEQPPVSSARRGGLWMLRVAIYLGAFFLCFQLLAPKISEVVFWLSAVPVAAIAIAVEIIVSSRVEHRSIESTIGSRLLIIDHLLSTSPSMVSRQLEGRRRDEQAALGRQLHQQAPKTGPDGFDIDQDYWAEADQPPVIMTDEPPEHTHDG
jgi:hypothetical protein